MTKKILFILMVFFLFGNLFSYSKKPKETVYRNSFSFAYSPVNSIFEDDNIILQIYEGKLWAKNKTSKTLFIDKSQCFLINNGVTYPISSYMSKNTSSSRANVSNSEEFITIGPNTGTNQKETLLAYFDTDFYHKYDATKTANINISEYDLRFFNLIYELVKESFDADPNTKFEYRKTTSRHLTEDESINNIGASIAYNFNKRSEEWTTVTISTWISDVIFAPYYIELPSIQKRNQIGFGLQKPMPLQLHIKGNSPFEFDEERSPITVADWEGDIKKGVFELKQPFDETFFKEHKIQDISNSILKYDGEDDDWGTLKKTKYGNNVK